MPAPELFQIPPDWQVARLEDVALSHKGAIKIGPFGSQLKKSDMTSSGFKVYGQENVFSDDFTLGDRFITRDKFESLQTCELFEGDIVLTMMGTVGAASIVPKGIHRGVMDSHLLRIRPNGRKIVDGFLRILLRDSPVTKRQVERMSQGGIMSGLNAGIVRTLELPLPPLPEQKKIAAILSSVDEAIQATQLVIDQTRRVKEGLLQDLLTHGLPGHTRFKQTEIGEIPEGWEVATGRELAGKGDLVGGPFGSDLGAADYVQVGVPVIRGGNVGLGKFIESDFVYVSPDKARLLRRNSAQRGDLIMTQRGASLGEATLIPDGTMFDSYVISQTMMRLRPNSQVVDPLFLIQSICSDRAQSWLKSRAIGNAQPHLNLSIWQDMPVAIPPKKEQIQIASIVASLDDEMAASGKEVAALTSLKSGLLADLLTGKVRVTP